MPGRFRTSGPSGRGTPLLSTERGGKTQEETGWGTCEVSLQISGHRAPGPRPVLNGKAPCHSRAGGNPGSFGRFPDSCLHRGDKVGFLRRNLQSSGCFHRHRCEQFFVGAVSAHIFGVSAGGYRIERWVVPLPRPTATTAHAVPIPPPSKHPAAPSALRDHLHAALETFSPDCCECVTRFLGKFTGFHRKNVGKRYEAASQPCRGVWYTVFFAEVFRWDCNETCGFGLYRMSEPHE